MQNGMENFIDEAEDKILFDQPEAVEALKFMKELKDIGLVEWDNTQADQNPFKNETAAMTILNENEFNGANTGELEGKLKMVPMFSNKTVQPFAVCISCS